MDLSQVLYCDTRALQAKLGVNRQGPKCVAVAANAGPRFLIQIALSSILRSGAGVTVRQPALPKRLSGKHIDCKKVAIGPEFPKGARLG
jgi:hypothetical protein